jgi:3-oxoacyl-[acyl-carrier-protein] synthase II
MKRVAVTGIGILTPIGNDSETTWENLTRGISGIGTISRFDPFSPELPSRIAGELKKFSAEDFISKKDVIRLDPFVHYAAAASLMAFEDSRIRLNKSDGYRTGVAIGSSRGGVMSMERALEQHLLRNKPFSAYLMSSSTINMASSYVSMRLGVRGPVFGISTACASGANAVGEAVRLIQRGEIDTAIAGGAEAPVCRLTVGGYGATRCLSRRNEEPEKASRPFDRDRDGFVIAEGSGIVVLEELERALTRGARIYAEIAGYGTCSDAFHQTRPDSKGEAYAIRKAINDAGISISDIDLIDAHATSTVLGDRAESQAINDVFGEGAPEIPVCSYKSMLGHMLGGAGAVEAALTALSISYGIITPNINIENQDIDCNLKHMEASMKKEIRYAVSNSFGFGGVNSVLVLKRFKEV